MLADPVQEVLDAELELEQEQVKPVPRIGAKLNVNFYLGIGTHKEQFMMILNIDKNFHAVGDVLAQGG